MRGAGLVRLVTTLACLHLVASAAWGQAERGLVDRVEQISRQLDVKYRLTVAADQPLFERLLLDHRLSSRFAFIAVDNEFGSTRILRQSDNQLQLLAQLDGAHTFYGRLRFLYNDFNSGDSFDDRGDTLEQPLSDRYWYEYDDRRRRIAETGEGGANNLRLRVGRDYLQWGTGLSLGNVLYQAIVDIEVGDLRLRGLVGETPATQTVDFDGSRPEFDTTTRRAYYGAELHLTANERHVPYVSYLIQRDGSHPDNTLVPTGLIDVPTSFRYHSEYLAVGMRGVLGAQWAYQLELVHESGRSRSNPFDPATGFVITQTDDHIDAWAGIASLSYLFRDEGDSRLTFELMGATGDTDRLDANDTFGGNTSGTADNAFNGLGYINTGLALAPQITNLLMFRVGLSTSPRPRYQQYDWLRTGVDLFLFAKTETSAPLSVATLDEKFIGAELNVYADWQIASDLVASVRYGVFLPGEAMPSGQDDPRHFLYAGVTVEF